MRRLGWLLLSALLSCQGTIGDGPRERTVAPAAPGPDLVTTPAPQPSPSPSAPPMTPPLPSVAVCSGGAGPQGRGYVGLDGELLEAGRPDAIALQDVDRPYRIFDKYGLWTLPGDVQRAIGSDSFTDAEHRDPGLGGSFGVPPEHWYAESEVGSFAVFTTFAYAFKACRRTIDAPPRRSLAGWYEHTAFPPTSERAAAFCERTQTEAWLRPPTIEERSACVALALDLEEEPDPKARWAYVCASILASSNFLSF